MVKSDGVGIAKWDDVVHSSLTEALCPIHDQFTAQLVQAAGFLVDYCRFSLNSG